MNTLLQALSVASLAGLVAAVRAPESAPAPAPAAESYKIDATHSSVVFKTMHVGISESYGRFNTISDESSLTLSDDPSQCAITLIVDAESVDTNSGNRDKHLRSADFFNSKEFPEIVFESKKVTGGPDGYKVTGDLTFLGKTKSVECTARLIGKGEAMGAYRAGFSAELTVDMKDFGVAFMEKNPGALGPEVTLIVGLECLRQ